jgi:hypothetical protein
MAVLTIPNVFNNGEVIDAPQMNSNFTAVKNFVEGLSQGDNFDTGAINTADIADNAITSAKIASTAVTSAKLASSLTLTTPNIGVATGTSLETTGNIISHIAQNTQVASYTLALTDDGRLINMNVGSANNLTIPLNSSVAFPIGTQILINQLGAGQTTIVATGGVTINATPGLKLRAQNSLAVCIKVGTDTWLAGGDLSV